MFGKPSTREKRNRFNIDFRRDEPLPEGLSPFLLGTATVGRGAEGDGENVMKLAIGPTNGTAYRDSTGVRGASGYSDAQLFDYMHRSRRDMGNRPPLRMTVRAWASHEQDQLIGTAGFGFWNQPVMPGEMTFRLPRAVWFFFGSKPSNMAFAKGVPGWGWKAATLDTTRAGFLALAPTAPIGFLLMRIPSLYNLLWPIAQRAMGVYEVPLAVKLTEPHTYRLDWLPDSASFYVDDQLVAKSPYSPRGPLGFVAWLDNQYAIVTPQGQIGMGILPVPHRQWLTIESLSVEPLD